MSSYPQIFSSVLIIPVADSTREEDGYSLIMDKMLSLVHSNSSTTQSSTDTNLHILTNSSVCTTTLTSIRLGEPESFRVLWMINYCCPRFRYKLCRNTEQCPARQLLSGAQIAHIDRTLKETVALIQSQRRHIYNEYTNDVETGSNDTQYPRHHHLSRAIDVRNTATQSVLLYTSLL